jgi:hypothetical protein
VAAGSASSVEGTVFGQTVDPVNPVSDDGSHTAVLDLNVGPLSLTADQVVTDCSQSSLDLPPVTQTCSASLQNFNFSLDGLGIVSTDMFVVESTSTNDGTGASSENSLTEIANLCILQTAGGPCTPVTGPSVYIIDIDGVAQGTITVAAQDPTTSEGGVAGSGLTVTSIKINLTTPSGDIDLDVGRAHTFVSDQAVTATPSPTPALLPPPAPTATPAQLPTPVARPRAAATAHTAGTSPSPSWPSSRESCSRCWRCQPAR